MKKHYSHLSRQTFKIGQEVIIYHDPFTKRYPEGTALLKRPVDREAVTLDGQRYSMERWMVEFRGQEVVERTLTFDLRAGENV